MTALVFAILIADIRPRPIVNIDPDPTARTRGRSKVQLVWRPIHRTGLAVAPVSAGIPLQWGDPHHDPAIDGQMRTAANCGRSAPAVPAHTAARYS